jgi:hypothetical protein
VAYLASDGFLGAGADSVGKTVNDGLLRLPGPSSGAGGAVVVAPSGGGIPLGLRITLGQSYTRHELEALGLTEEEIMQLLAMGWLLLT